MVTYPERAGCEFGEQSVMTYIGLRVFGVVRGRTWTRLEVRTELSQNHAFVHAGALTSIVDATAGSAAKSLLEPRQPILTADFTVNLLRPATGASNIVDARIITNGRTLIFGRAIAMATGFQVDDSESLDLQTVCGHDRNVFRHRAAFDKRTPD